MKEEEERLEQEGVGNGMNLGWRPRQASGRGKEGQGKELKMLYRGGGAHS